jgi:AraC-like DNA-binding protein
MKALGHLRIEEVELPPGQEWTDAEPVWHFVRVSSGAAYWLDPAKPRAFTEGELVVSGPVIKAVIRASQLTEVVLHWFGFAPELLYGFFTVAERRLFEAGSESAGRSLQFLPSTHPVTQRFVFLANQRTPQNELTQRTEVLGLVTAFFGERVIRQQPGPPAALAPNAHDRFEQIISQMPELELIHHTPEQLARLCGCSPRHFNRLFHERFGESPRARQTELRLLKARQLLTDTDQKVVQIALDSGYRSLSLFNSLFKRRFGVSPSEWRQKWAGNGPKEDNTHA